ncbi:response regulator [Planctomicrobium piriforme]|uniref:Two-component system, OmpR family, KDP operon response regulator KdpE n=1 Tax=Planctomicrobium piriforme TaxID=1576369 RepID=A0A1I3SXI9_9PLAN|nr:response regulator [Planctomicrobium piriforme]SFJ63568.1 two-component system, OmpR family, KDP operon response regulator KdpE [Planctomicrobium piriforme]
MPGGDHLILIVEDEQPIRRFLKASLSNEGYRVLEAENGQDGLRLAASQPPDLVILDLGLPDLDGQHVLKQLRDWFTGPVIVLSARDQETQKIQALDSGADDYVTKPFSIGELLARLRTALRHTNRGAAESSVVTIGDLKVDLTARLVYRRETEVHLTPLEYKLLVTMLKHAGKVLTHRFLLREVWGPQDSRENHYLRVFVASLRRKLEDDPARPRYLLTEQGVGYRFAADDPRV